MKKLLITGASGFLGWNLGQLARQRYQVYGTYCSKTVEIEGVTQLQLDFTDFQATQQLWRELKPDAVIHTAAQSSPNYCQNYPQQSYAINVTAAANIAGLCADAGIACAFTSSDLVFDGKHPPYRETDPVCPVSVYGEQKVLAEQQMLERYPQTAVCRMPLMFGEVPPFASSFIQPFLKILRQGNELTLFTDEYRTPASGQTAAKGLLLAVEKISGILHLGGIERVSRYEFGCLMAEVLDLPKSLIKACQQQDVPMAAPRPKDVSSDSSKAFALGYQPLTLREELMALKGKV